MKFIGKLLIYALIILSLMMVTLCFLLQTRWAAKQISNWVTNNSDYQLTFDTMVYHFSSPSHLTLRNVTFGHDGSPAILVAGMVDIGLSSRQFTDPLHLDSLLLQEGSFHLAPQVASLPLRADRLQLKDMTFDNSGHGWDLSARRVTGGVSPWQPEAGRALGRKAQIQMSAGSLTINGVSASNVLIQGNIDNNEITLSTIGADIARGSLTGAVRRNADGGWIVESLRLNEIRLQSDKSLADLLASAMALPSLQINRIEVTDARLQGPEWAVTDLDLNLRNLTLIKGNWQSQEGRLSMNASGLIYGSLHLVDPIVRAEFSSQGIALRQFTSRWEGGVMRASGSWQRSDKALVLDDMTIVGLEYTLAQNWKQRWMAPLPAWLNSVMVKKFSASRNLIIDIDPTFPWQITALDGYGVDLQLARHREWGVWSGSTTLNAADATFNRVDVRRPSMSLTANAAAITISELSAFTEKGILEATATVSQQPPRQINVSLNARGVPLDLLQPWGWTARPLPGDGNLQLTVSGSLQAERPLKPSVNGRLHAINMQKQQVTQIMRNGEIDAAATASASHPILSSESVLATSP